jgi:hypothetical protein
MAEGIDELLKDIDNVLGDQTESTQPKEDKEDDADSLMSEIDSVLSPQQPTEEKPKEEIPQAVEEPKEEGATISAPTPAPAPAPAPTPAPITEKEPEIDFSKPINIVSTVIGEKPDEQFTLEDRQLIETLDPENLYEFKKIRPDVTFTEKQNRQIFEFERQKRESSPYGKVPTNAEEWFNLGINVTEDAGDIFETLVKSLEQGAYGAGKAVVQGAPALVGMTSDYAEAKAAEKLLPEDKKAEVESWRKRAWQIANTPVKGGEQPNPDAYTDAKYLAKIKEYLTPEQSASIDKEFEEKRYKAKQVPYSLTAPIAALPPSITWTAQKVGSGGMQTWDNVSEKFGFLSKEDAYNRWSARNEVDTAQAKWLKAQPNEWKRFVDTYYVPTLKSFSSLTHPSVKEYMIMYPDLSAEEAASKREADIESSIISVVDDVKKSIPETDPEMAAFADLALPEAFGLDQVGYAMNVVRAAGQLTPIARKTFQKLRYTDDQINAIEKRAQELLKAKQLKRLEALKKPGLVEQGAGAVSKGIEKTGDYIERSPRLQKLGTGLTAIGGAALGYELSPENALTSMGLGALATRYGLKYGGRTLADIPKVIKEVQAARRISAGGSVGPLATLGAIAKQQDEVKTLTQKLKTLSEGTDEYVETKQALEVAKSRVKNEGIVDYEGIGRVSDTTKRILRFVGDDTIANIGEYARMGVEPTLISLAVGIIDSADEEELKAMVGQGLAYSLGGRAVQQTYHKFVGQDPVIQIRRAKQANMDALKAYRDSTPETRGEIDKLTDWDLVIGRQAKRVADTEAEVQKLVNESPDNKKIEEAEKRLEAEKKSLSLLKTANVQTRNEFGRQFLTALGRNNLLLNGALKAGQNNVGIHILSTDQIFNHFRQNPALRDVPDEMIYEIAGQQGFYSGTGQNEFRPGMEVSDAVKNVVFNQAQPSIVINSDALRNRIDIYGETPIDALNHETGHAILRIKEIQDAVSEARKLLFSNQIRDAAGNVKEVTTGLYNEDQLIDLYEKTYLKNYNKKQIEVFAKNSGLWDYGTNSLSRKNVADYMQEEILADLFSNTLSRNLGKNIDPKSIHLLDVARAKLKNNLIKKATTKLLGLGFSGDVVGYASKANLPPEVQSAARNAMRLLESLNGDFATIENQPETATISKADIRKSKIAAERYGMDSGLFATKVQAQVFDADGNPVGTPVDVTDPAVFEGTWRITKDGEERLNGYGQIPVELRQLQVPEGGTLAISKKIVTEADGITPKLLKPADLKKIAKDRATLFKQAIDTPDYGTPGRFEAVSEGSDTYRGTFTPLQIKAIQALPEGIVPLKIKEYLLELNDAIVKKDGSRFFVDYAAVMDDKGNYRAFSPKIYDVVPIGLHLSEAGNFLVTTISVGRMMSKLNAWSDRMPNRLSPWNGSKETFWSEFSTKYLDNWSKGIQGSGYNDKGEPEGTNQLSDNVAVAEQKKSIFNDFLNLFTKETEALNLDRTKIPKRKGDEKNKSMDRTIMSMRIDHMAELIDASDLPKLPVDYEKAKKNFLPAEVAEIEAPSGERGFQSKLQMEIQSKFRGAMATPEQLKAVINNPQNVKAEEVKWSGVNDAIDRLASENNGKVPVQELLNYLRDEGQVKFEEVTLGGKEPFDANRLAELEAEYKNLKDHPVDDPSFGEEKYDELIRLMNIRDQSTTDTLYDEAERVMRLAQQAQRRGDKKTAEKYFRENEFLNTRAEKLDLQGEGLTKPPKFGKYQLPGGENYREVVMAMPRVEESKFLTKSELDEYQKLRFETDNRTPEQQARLDQLFIRIDENNAASRDDQSYTSSHFPDIPNYVAHMRLNERTDAEGNDGLFIEELQSDRHQAGREKGYQGQGDVLPDGWTVEEVPVYEYRGGRQTGTEWMVFDASKTQVGFGAKTKEEAIKSANSGEVPGSIPDAPFRKDWSLQLFKRALRDAVESGKQWIGWTTGETQAERYKLSKQVDSIVVILDGENTYALSAYKDGQSRINEEKIPEAKLSEFIGKELSAQSIEKIKSSPQPSLASAEFEGLDLDVGGEGMKGFYDTILPKEIGKYVSKMGGKVEKSEIATTKPDKKIDDFTDAELLQELARKGDTTPIWRVNITPQMENVVRAGQLQFMPAEVEGATTEPEGLQGIELPTQYRRISDMIPPLRDIEPPVRPVQEMPADSQFKEIESASNDLIQYRDSLNSRIQSGTEFSNAVVAPPGIQYLPAWHGSPYDFDRFSIEKIGEGEGAQAYGWGLYFAGLRQVSEGYQTKLAKNIRIDGVESPSEDVIQNQQIIDLFGILTDALKARKSGGMPDRKTIDRAIRMLEDEKDAATDNAYAEEILNWWFNAGVKGLKDPSKIQVGSLYKVDIDVEEGDLLDWDKPLSEQSKKVQDAVLPTILSEFDKTQKAREAIIQRGTRLGGRPFRPGELERLQKPMPDPLSITGKSAYVYITNAFGGRPAEDAPKASKFLLEQGVPGIRYWDALSRGAGEGTSNYVVFDDKLIKILEKDDKPVGPIAQFMPPAIQFLPKSVERTMQKDAGDFSVVIGGKPGRYGFDFTSIAELQPKLESAEQRKERLLSYLNPNLDNLNAKKDALTAIGKAWWAIQDVDPKQQPFKERDVEIYEQNKKLLEGFEELPDKEFTLRDAIRMVEVDRSIKAINDAKLGMTPPPFKFPVDRRVLVPDLQSTLTTIFKSKKFKDFIVDAAGLQGINFDNILGTWKFEVEPSFVFNAPGMTWDQAQTVTKWLSFLMTQDAGIAWKPSIGLTDGAPAVYLVHDKKLTEEQIKNAFVKAEEVGIDGLSLTVDGKGIKAANFDGIKEFGKKLIEIQKAANIKNFHDTLVDSFYYDTTSDFTAEDGSVRVPDWLTGKQTNETDIQNQQGGMEEGVRGVGGDSAPGGLTILLRRGIDTILVPYAKVLAGQGFTFDPNRFAERYGLGQEVADYIREQLYPATGLSRSVTPILEGTEKFVVPDSFYTKEGKLKTKVDDLLYALQKRSADDGFIEPGDYSPRAGQIISETIVDEVLGHIERAKQDPNAPNAIGWYDTALKLMKERYAKFFPFLDRKSKNYDANKEFIFDAVLGITSQGNNVFENGKMAARVQFLLEGGKTLPELVKKDVGELYGTFGGETRAVENNFLKLHELLQNNDIKKLDKLFRKKMSVSEWNAYLKQNKNLWFKGEPLTVDGQAEQMVTGFSVFGPKIGSFINNLHGDYSTLTADLWYTRTWNRILGNVFQHAPLKEANQYVAFQKALIEQYRSDVAKAAGEKFEPLLKKVKEKDGKKVYEYVEYYDEAELTGKTNEEIQELFNDPQAMLDLATTLEKRFRSGQYKQKSDLRRAAKNWVENRADPVAAPRTDLERDFQQSTMELAQKKLRRKGIDITIADMQAALWYNEKELFGLYGAQVSGAEPADYADAAENVEEMLDYGTLFQLERTIDQDDGTKKKELIRLLPYDTEVGLTGVQKPKTPEEYAQLVAARKKEKEDAKKEAEKIEKAELKVDKTKRELSEVDPTNEKTKQKLAVALAKAEKLLSDLKPPAVGSAAPLTGMKSPIE